MPGPGLALEQLGYLAESSTWRNAYLFGAHELRHGMPNTPARSTIGPHILGALPTDQLLDYLAVRVNAPKAEGLRIVMNWIFTDTGEKFCLTLANSALSTSARRPASAPDTTVTMTRTVLNEIIAERSTFEAAAASGAIQLDGDPTGLFTFLALLDTCARMLEIVEPRRKPIA
mgnify:CR=1 FL=1